MAKLKVGDRVLCRIKENTIINPYNSDYDELRTFDIITTDSLGYYLFVPPYTVLKGTIKVDQYNLKKLNLDKKYFNDTIVYISSGFVYKIKSQIDGCICCVCKDFYDKAAPNQEDGTMICWSCRDNPWR